MILNKEKEIQKIIRDFRLLDDDFMSKVFDEKTFECIQFVLRIILDDDDLVVIDSSTQKERKSITGHSVKFDVYAKTGAGQEIDVEIQRADNGAVPQRARYNSALLDSGMLTKNTDYSKLKDSYVIFITEKDVLKSGKAIYHIDRTIKEIDNELFQDGSHIIYVNGEYVGNDKIGQLMHDFRCDEPSEMNFKILKDRTEYLKEKGGYNAMCKSVEDFGKRIAEEVTKEVTEEVTEKVKNENEINTISTLLKNNMSPEWIHTAFNYPMDTIKKVQQSISQ